MVHGILWYLRAARRATVRLLWNCSYDRTPHIEILLNWRYAEHGSTLHWHDSNSDPVFAALNSAAIDLAECDRDLTMGAPEGAGGVAAGHARPVQRRTGQRRVSLCTASLRWRLVEGGYDGRPVGTIHALEDAVEFTAAHERRS